jgi:hypothetical protein
VWEEYRIRVAKQTLSRQLRAMGFRKLSARPRHYAHNEHAAEAPTQFDIDSLPAGWKLSYPFGSCGYVQQEVTSQTGGLRFVITSGISEFSLGGFDKADRHLFLRLAITSSRGIASISPRR